MTTREVNVTSANWTAVTKTTAGPIEFQVNDSFVWAFAGSTAPTITGFTGVSGTLYQLFSGSKTLWIKSSNTGKKCQVNGGIAP